MIVELLLAAEDRSMTMAAALVKRLMRHVTCARNVSGRGDWQDDHESWHRLERKQFPIERGVALVRLRLGKNPSTIFTVKSELSAFHHDCAFERTRRMMILTTQCLYILPQMRDCAQGSI